MSVRSFYLNEFYLFALTNYSCLIAYIYQSFLKIDILLDLTLHEGLLNFFLQFIENLIESATPISNPTL